MTTTWIPKAIAILADALAEIRRRRNAKRGREIIEAIRAAEHEQAAAEFNDELRDKVRGKH